MQPVTADAVAACRLANAAAGLGTFAGDEAREARKAWQQEAASQQC